MEVQDHSQVAIPSDRHESGGSLQAREVTRRHRRMARMPVQGVSSLTATGADGVLN